MILVKTPKLTWRGIGLTRCSLNHDPRIPALTAQLAKISREGNTAEAFVLQWPRVIVVLIMMMDGVLYWSLFFLVMLYSDEKLIWPI